MFSLIKFVFLALSYTTLAIFNCFRLFLTAYNIYSTSFLIIGLMVFFLAGCSYDVLDAASDAYSWGENRFKREKHYPRALRTAVFSGTPGNEQKDDPYAQGFQQGCTNATATIGAGSYRLNSIKIDGYRLLDDNKYLKGFSDGMTYCTFRLDWETH